MDKLTDEDLLREAMNTIGKKGKLGEHIRCVVSVAMLTEGWDANTVTHILGIRPFRSQLLCEQVVGRGLRRRSYAVNPDTAGSSPSTPRSTACRSRSSPATGRSQAATTHGRRSRSAHCPSAGDLAIQFPKLDGYRVELPDEELHADFDEDSRLHLDQATVALWVKNQGVIGAAAEVRPRRHPQRAPPARRLRDRQDAHRAGSSSSPPSAARSGPGCSRSSSTSHGAGSTSASRRSPR